MSTPHPIESSHATAALCRSIREAFRYLRPRDMGAMIVFIQSDGEQMRHHRMPSNDPTLNELRSRFRVSWLSSADRSALGAFAASAAYQEARYRFHRDWRNAEHRFMSFEKFLDVYVYTDEPDEPVDAADAVELADAQAVEGGHRENQ